MSEYLAVGTIVAHALRAAGEAILKGGVTEAAKDGCLFIKKRLSRKDGSGADNGSNEADEASTSPEAEDLVASRFNALPEHQQQALVELLKRLLVKIAAKPDIPLDDRQVWLTLENDVARR